MGFDFVTAQAHSLPLATLLYDKLFVAAARHKYRKQETSVEEEAVEAQLFFVSLRSRMVPIILARIEQWFTRARLDCDLPFAAEAQHARKNYDIGTGRTVVQYFDQVDALCNKLCGRSNTSIPKTDCFCLAGVPAKAYELWRRTSGSDEGEGAGQWRDRFKRQVGLRPQFVFGH